MPPGPRVQGSFSDHQPAAGRRPAFRVVIPSGDLRGDRRTALPRAGSQTWFPRLTLRDHIRSLRVSTDFYPQEF